MATTARSPETAPESGLRPIADVAGDLGLEPDEVEPYGRFKAKIAPVAFDRRSAVADGKLVVVTSMTPTPTGEGKTTTAISLAEALGSLGERCALCLREPSLGPVFGLKGGGTGGGRAQVVPMDEINLHFTGDIHAVSAATNLLAALVDAHVLHGNSLGLDPHSITWRRCLDVNDRALRQIVTGLGGRTNGAPRETGFDIAAASEVMAILSIAADHADLRRRLGAITVGSTRDGEPVTADDLGAAGSMAALLADALHPNLVQTMEGLPALVHGGPFANIAHGTNSLVADRLALKLADFVVTESGFGADMGFEKFVDIVCRIGGLRPSVAVVVATVQALKHHGGDPEGGVDAIERGAENLAAHLRLVEATGLRAVVAVNRFPGDTSGDVRAAVQVALDHGAAAAAVNDGYTLGPLGAEHLAAAVVEAAAEPSPPRFLYGLDEPIAAKLHAVARTAYGANGVSLAPEATAAAERLERLGLDRLPVCMAKTHLSRSHDPALLGAPSGFVLPVRDLRPYTGAGWIVALCGAIQTMPGLGASPAALRIDVDANGRPTGLR